MPAKCCSGQGPRTLSKEARVPGALASQPTCLLSPSLPPTYGDVRGAVSLQEAVEVMPDLGNPVDDFYQLHIPHAPTDLRFHEFPPQEPAKETFHGLRVVGTKHPPGEVRNAFQR